MRLLLIKRNLLLAVIPCALASANPERDAAAYAEAIEKINAAHARNPGDTTEDELASKLPPQAGSALERVLKAKPSPEASAALLRCGEAALDLALLDSFAEIRARLLETDPATAARLGDAIAEERFLVRTVGEFEATFLPDFSRLTSGILDAYNEVFGFREWSKVPGKRVRIRVHLVEKITRPPHFAPQFPFHSEIDMPVLDPREFSSPTANGQMTFYGLCHEFGHLIAMWGDRDHEEDHHAWAHFTGVAVVEHMAGTPKYGDLLRNRRDARWRSLALETKAAEGVAPSAKDRAGVMALFLGINEAAGSQAIGAALNRMDAGKAGHRINHVRYYGLKDLRKALNEVIDDKARRDAVEALFSETR